MALDMFEFDYRQFNPQNPYMGDDKLPVRFYIGAVRDDAASESASRPIYRDVDCIQIFNSKDNVIDRPVRDTDKQRWPNAYAAFKQSGKGEPGTVGTPLEHWPLMTRAQVEEYRYFKIFTVEQLAEMPDSIGGQIQGFQRLKALAKVMMEVAKGDAPFVKMRAEMEKRDGEIAELKAEVQRLTKLAEAAHKAGMLPQ